MWFRVSVRGKPVHVLEAGSGINAIEASYVRLPPCSTARIIHPPAKQTHRHHFVSSPRLTHSTPSYHLYGALKHLEEKMNAPEVRHAAYKDMRHPINFNFGVVHGGDWPSSVPSHCWFDVRVGFFPGVAIKDVQRDVEECVAKAAAAAKTPINYTLAYRGFQAEVRGVAMWQ